MLALKIIKPFFLLGMRIISLVVYASTVIAALGGKINPDYLTLPALFCLALPYFTILTILMVIFWAICRKIFFCALGLLTIFVCLTPLSDAFPLGSPRIASGSGETFKIISWNVLHTNDIREKDFKGNRAVDFMINSGADIICFAELKNFSESEIRNMLPSQQDSLFSLYPYKAGLNTTDLKVLSRYPVERMEKMSINTIGGCRFDFFKIRFPQDKNLVVAMVHLFSYGLSPEERKIVTEINSMETAKTSMKEFKGSIREKMHNAFKHRAEDAEALREAINEIPDDTPLIICGDFNDVPSSWTYNIVRGEDMRDAYAETNLGPAFTYNLHAFYFHIDQMLYRGPLEAIDVTVGKINTSDHYPLIGEFEFK